MSAWAPACLLVVHDTHLTSLPISDLRNVCTEAGMFAIRDDRDYIVQDDLNKAVRKLQEAKKHECTCLQAPQSQLSCTESNVAFCHVQPNSTTRPFKALFQSASAILCHKSPDRVTLGKTGGTLDNCFSGGRVQLNPISVL